MRSLNRPNLSSAGLCLAVLVVLLAACQSPTPVAPSATPAPTQPPTPEPSPTPTPRTLVVCLGQEPQTLFLYGGLSKPAWSVLEAIYDGPFDQRDYGEQPVILEKLPSLADGDVAVQPVEVVAGDQVVDAQGNLNTLVEGVRVYPSGCTNATCAVSYDGKSPLQMDQMKVTYKLLSGLKWADGQPLSASDSVYSFQLAASADLPVSKAMIERTVSYQVVDDVTVEWVGTPGYRNTRLSSTFWTPLPEHLLATSAPADLLQADAAARRPMGWGPYQIDEWVAGDHIRLSKNANYFRAAEGLPAFDYLVYRFLKGTGSDALQALQAGECDILDQTTLLEDQIDALTQLESSGDFRGYYISGPEWEHLDFGIKPASYDDSFNMLAGDRPDLFGDARTRQAFALCADRQALVEQALSGRSQALNTYLPPNHPLAYTDAPAYGFDPAAGAALLDQVGWKDSDDDPATPRVAQGVINVPDGTPLSVNYWTTEAALRQETSDLLAKSFAQCGIQATVQYFPPADLYASGPAGKLFGRSFDLVQFTWEGNSQPMCYLYTSGQIPSLANNWIGVNVTGYSNAEFDAACESAMNALPGTPEYAEYQRQAQEIFARDLPVIPLYLQVRVAAGRSTVCGFEPNVTTRSSLWNIEAINAGDGCGG